MPQGDNNQKLLENTYTSMFGLNAGNVIVGTGAIPAGTYCALQILSSTATITSLTENGTAVTAYANSITYNQGMIIYGYFTGGTIASGFVKMYAFNPVIS
jgi:hypothetical protein